MRHMQTQNFQNTSNPLSEGLKPRIYCTYKSIDLACVVSLAKVKMRNRHHASGQCSPPILVSRLNQMVLYMYLLLCFSFIYVLTSVLLVDVYA